MKPTLQLYVLRQSLWLDNITRNLPDHLCGVNPKVSKRHLPDCEQANCRL